MKSAIQTPLARSGGCRARLLSLARHEGRASTRLVLLLVVFLSAHLGAATYYVAKNGNDGNPGTASLPWLTINHACSTAVAGDTVRVAAGTYSEIVNFNKNGGTAAAPIVFKSDAYWNTEILGTVRVYKPHIVMDSFRIHHAGTDKSGVVVWGDTFTIKNCEVVMDSAHAQEAIGIHLAWGAGPVEYYGITVDHCTVHGWGTSAGGTGLYIEGSYSTITNNVIYDNYHYGIQVFSENWSVDSCLVAYNSCSGSVELGGINFNGSYNWVHDNLIYDNPHYNAVGIYIINNPARGNVIENNTLYNNYYGIWSLSVHPNTFRNNIVLGSVSLPLYVKDSTTEDYNCYWPDNWFTHGSVEGNWAKYRAGSGQDAHGILADPMLTDTGEHDFHLKASSPCVDAGDSTTPAGYDFDCISTPQAGAVDLGAYEYHPFARTRDCDRDTALLATASNIKLAIAPNPLTGGFAAVEFSLPRNQAGAVEAKFASATLEVFNAAGRLVQSSIVYRLSSISLDLRSAPSGVYLVRLQAEGVTSTQKLIVEH